MYYYPIEYSYLNRLRAGSVKFRYKVYIYHLIKNKRVQIALRPNSASLFKVGSTDIQTISVNHSVQKDL